MAVASQKKGRKSRGRKQGLHKPHGKLHPRVQAVGPEHFGIVSVDCAKARSKWMLADFYGHVLLEPQQVSHEAGSFSLAVATIRETCQQRGIVDLTVAVERTGNYHLPVKRAFTSAGLECRIVHPFATKQFRQPANPGNKTDDNDLAAIHRAAVNGFGLLDLESDPLMRELKLLVRHRRDLVHKRSAVCCQMREHLEQILPGYAACFTNLWDSQAGLCLARRFARLAEFRQADLLSLTLLLKQAGLTIHRATLEKVLAWARTAPDADLDAAVQHRIFLTLEIDRDEKTRQIRALECNLVKLLAGTPYVLLISAPGVNVVSAAELAGEMGPITHYASAKAITGRAGLYPARYQSDQVDLKDGRVVRCANRSLRAALLMVADNLRKCNPYFRGLADLWKSTKGDCAERVRIKIASRFSRIAFQIVAGRQVFQHPGLRERSCILEKLLAFQQDHGADSQDILATLQQAVEQLPKSAHQPEADPLLREMLRTRVARARGPQPLKDILLLVLAKLGVSHLQSDVSGEGNPS